MAATGLPEKRKDHAVLMARFARDCLKKMLYVVRKLEIRLGPGKQNYCTALHPIDVLFRFHILSAFSQSLKFKILLPTTPFCPPLPLF